MNKMRSLYFILAVTGFVIMTGFFWTDRFVINKVVFSGQDSVSFKIPKKAAFNEIASILRAKNIDVSDLEFKFTAKWLEKDRKIKYGKYTFHPEKKPVRLKDLITQISEGNNITVNVTIPEGSRLVEIAGTLKKYLDVDSAAFMDRVYDQDVLDKYKIPAQSLEGYLYPETYNFNMEENIDLVIERMYNTGRQKLYRLKNKIDNNALGEHGIITLASIIQGEVMNYDEIRLISAVYHNRLKRGMLLQADPTVQYMFDRPKRLLKTDTSIDNPYNTYKYKGLPPGPINNPSVKAVEAALDPADAPYLFMVAKGDGTHNFNVDLNDHINDKNRFDRNVRKEKK
ncbi:MAG TPA: endolytic transglycosylase MltG [Clostridiales bacterium]|nr:endolytic transglycosylase MltG [Clostridiales bacterium]HQP70014.1 endolytic transglycosylase MltG [Clostridiales bacterium]